MKADCHINYQNCPIKRVTKNYKLGSFSFEKSVIKTHIFCMGFYDRKRKAHLCNYSLGYGTFTHFHDFMIYFRHWIILCTMLNRIFKAIVIEDKGTYLRVVFYLCISRPRHNFFKLYDFVVDWRPVSFFNDIMSRFPLRLFLRVHWIHFFKLGQ